MKICLILMEAVCLCSNRSFSHNRQAFSQWVLFLEHGFTCNMRLHSLIKQLAQCLTTNFLKNLAIETHQIVKIVQYCNRIHHTTVTVVLL